MITMKSESANKTQQNNAKILFGSKGVSVLTKLEEYSKEKALDTAGIDAVLDVLKTKDATLLQKFADSKTGKTLAKNCKQLAAAKTFTAIIKNIKQIKVLKSFDKFGAVPSKTPNSKANWADLSPKGKKPTHYIERDIVAELDSKNRFNLNDDATSDLVDLLKMSKVSGVEVIKRVGPGGGNPFVRILGNENTLGELINHFESEGDVDARATMPIKPLESTGQVAIFEGSLIQELAKTDAGRQELADRISKLNERSNLDFVVKTSFNRTKGFFLQVQGVDDLGEVHSVILGGLRGINRTWNPGTHYTKTVHKQGRFKDATEYPTLKAAVNAMIKATKKVLRKKR